jgi:streptogramin lyase
MLDVRARLSRDYAVFSPTVDPRPVNQATRGGTMRRRTGTLALLAAAGLALAQVAGAEKTAPPGVSAVIKTPGFPALAATGFGSVWIATHRGERIYRVDPKRNRVVARITLPDPIQGTLTVGAGSLWVSSTPEAGAPYLYRIDPRSNRVVGRRQGIVTAAVGDGSVWMSDPAHHAVLRVDPRNGHVLARIRKLGVGASRAAIVVGAHFGSVWLYVLDDAVVRISTRTNRVTSVIPLPGAKSAGSVVGGYLDGGPTVFAGGAAWVVNPAGLYRIDPQTDTAQLLPVHIRPFSEWALPGLAVDRGGRLFLRTSNRRVVQLDTTSGKVLGSFPATGGGGEIAAGFGSLWIANAAVDTVWRIRLHN